MDTRSISHVNLITGEVVDLGLKSANTKFIQRGHKMYNYGLEYMLDRFTNTEIKHILSIFDTSFIDYNNLIFVKFSKIFEHMDSSHRSKLKRKLIDNMVIQEHNKKIMLNPYIFVPRGDKNVLNSQHLTQKVWKYLFEDATIGTDEVVRHVEHMFGPLTSTQYIHVGHKEYAKIIKAPAPC
jgi:hypothetical protein